MEEEIKLRTKAEKNKRKKLVSDVILGIIFEHVCNLLGV